MNIYEQFLDAQNFFLWFSIATAINLCFLHWLATKDMKLEIEVIKENRIKHEKERNLKEYAIFKQGRIYARENNKPKRKKNVEVMEKVVKGNGSIQ